MAFSRQRHAQKAHLDILTGQKSWHGVVHATPMTLPSKDNRKYTSYIAVIEPFVFVLAYNNASYIVYGV
jgi:hypothetical protein